MSVSFGRIPPVMLNIDKCPICLDDFEETHRDDIIGHIQHAFHRACVSRWLAADHNTCPMCRSIIENRAIYVIPPGMTEEEHMNALTSAIYKDDRAKVTDLLTREVSVQNWEQLLTTAIARLIIRPQALGIVQLLINHRELPEDVRGRMVSLAAKRGHLEIVRSLLASGPIPLSDRYQAIKEASKCPLFNGTSFDGHMFGSREVVDLLLRGLSDGYLPSQTLGEMVIWIAEPSLPTDPVILNRLLSKGTIKERDLEKAIKVANKFRDRNQDIARLLEAHLASLVMEA